MVSTSGGWPINTIDQAAGLLIQCLRGIQICHRSFLGRFHISVPSGIDDSRSLFSLSTKYFHVPYFSWKGTYIKQVADAISPPTSDTVFLSKLIHCCL